MIDAWPTTARHTVRRLRHAATYRPHLNMPIQCSSMRCNQPGQHSKRDQQLREWDTRLCLSKTICSDTDCFKVTSAELHLTETSNTTNAMQQCTILFSRHAHPVTAFLATVFACTTRLITGSSDPMDIGSPKSCDSISTPPQWPLRFQPVCSTTTAENTQSAQMVKWHTSQLRHKLQKSSNSEKHNVEHIEINVIQSNTQRLCATADVAQFSNQEQWCRHVLHRET